MNGELRKEAEKSKTTTTVEDITCEDITIFCLYFEPDAG